MGRAQSLHLHSDSFTVENKNRIVLSYFISKLGLGYHDSIGWNFMTVGHTKCRPDEGFSNIFKHVSRRVEIFSIDQLCASINHSSTAKKICSVFSARFLRIQVRFVEKGKPLEDIKAYFAFKIHIGPSIAVDLCVICFDFFQTTGLNQNKYQNLKFPRPVDTYCNLSQFYTDPPKPFPSARNCILQDNVFNVLLKTLPTFSSPTKSFFLDELVCWQFDF